METTMKCASLDNDSRRSGHWPSSATWVNRAWLWRLVSRLRRWNRWYWRAFHRTAGSDLESVYYQEISRRK